MQLQPDALVKCTGSDPASKRGMSSAEAASLACRRKRDPSNPQRDAIARVGSQPWELQDSLLAPCLVRPRCCPWVHLAASRHIAPQVLVTSQAVTVAAILKSAQLSFHLSKLWRFLLPSCALLMRWQAVDMPRLCAALGEASLRLPLQAAAVLDGRRGRPRPGRGGRLIIDRCNPCALLTP